MKNIIYKKKKPKEKEKKKKNYENDAHLVLGLSWVMTF